MDYILNPAEGLCYVCDSKTTNSNERFISKVTKTTCISFPKMISTLISDDFVLIVSNEDLICDKCSYLVNKMDALQKEILTVRKSLSEFLAHKYHIPVNDPLEDLDKDHTTLISKKKRTPDPALSDTIPSTCKLGRNEALFQGLKNKSISRNNNVKMECSYCFKTFYSKQSLKNHVKICVYKNANVTKVNKNPPLIKNTSENNTDSDKDVVDKINSNAKDTADNHCIEPDYLNDVSKSNETYFLCELCNSLFKSANDFNKHTCQNSGKSCDSVEIISADNVDEEDCGDSHETLKSDKLVEVTIVDNHLLNDSNKKTRSVECPNINLSCYICGHVLSSRMDLAKHILSHYPVKAGDSNGKTIVCPVCNSNFVSLVDFMNHYDMHVNNASSGNIKKPNFSSKINSNKVSAVNTGRNKKSATSVHFPCPICKKCHDTYNELNMHLKLHNVNHCLTCKKDFPSDLKLKEHMVIHEAKVKLNQCEYCLLRFNSDNDLDKHVEVIHDQIKKSRACPLCRKKCASSFAVKRHVIKSHLIPVLQQEIREKYSQGSDLVDDMKSLGASEELIKSITNGTNETESDVNHLKMIVNVEASKVNFCLLCGFSSKSISNLDKHREKHSYKRIVCPLSCDYLSCDRDELTAHLSETHELILGNDCCPHCLCQLDEDVSLHMKALHGKFYAHLTCHICKEMFFTKESLKYHFSLTHLIFTDQQFQEKRNDEEMDDNSVDADDSGMNSDHISIQEDMNTELTEALRTITHDSAEDSEQVQCDEKSNQIDCISEVSQMSACGDEVFLDEQRNICIICRKDFKSEDDLSGHMNKHSVDSENIDCPLCELSLHDSIHMCFHMLNEHPAYSQLFCFSCKKSFPNRNSFIKHHTNECSNRTCELCSKHFVHIASFIHHRSYGHRKDFKCIHCKKLCKNLKHLKYHEKLHVRYKGKVFKCVQCNKTFQTPNGLKAHMISHTGNYPFVCEFCGRGFISSYSLSEHQASHSGDVRYCCELCGKSFRLYDTYNRHRKQHDNPFPVQCSECGRRFRNSSRVAEHKRKVHTGERPYACPYCSMTFTVSSSYRIHLCKHTRVFPYKCNLCDRGFPTRYKYTTHLAAKHKGVSNPNANN